MSKSVFFTNGAPLNCAPLNGAPLNGAPLNGAPLNGAPLNGAHHEKHSLIWVHIIKNTFKKDAHPHRGPGLDYPTEGTPRARPENARVARSEAGRGAGRGDDRRARALRPVTKSACVCSY